MQLIDCQTQLAEVDVEIHHQISWHWGREHFHEATGGQLGQCHSGWGGKTITSPC
uniref:Uncharacterized protein n=1 Tax=Anguilla anguilla TaxID=7936 RepID=A0A0E9XDT0_ANGAN